ncbi:MULTISPECIES: photosynthetic complex assembly protein PuhC [unclassified Sphingomonas]|uniref:photosynthetic complex assembly protein PuhC n=1 Tax=unclassified Sphingomonas TaxID=196159 RepID=UPI000BD6A9F6|nr:MAG: phosphonoacetaldehyde methylase [Sphingomonas sp. 12-62-6]OYX40263.1 MAG: phosphonoacetaldehyde methylase [Sphingomonas sp. 32-62-10]OYY65470.1 MAG: phosphonoacetaldehyde methylase [Sphingomonas sp. 28-62-11]
MTSAPHSHHVDVPKGALMMAGLLVVSAITVTSIARIAQIPPSASPVLMREATKVAPVATRKLRFSDRADGAVIIEDVGTGGTALLLEPGTNSGFIRGVMRGLARERRMQGIDSKPPFDLTLWKDGELSLTDTVTGRSIELNAFGTTNRATFYDLLTRPETPR